MAKLSGEMLKTALGISVITTAAAGAIVADACGTLMSQTHTITAHSVRRKDFGANESNGS